MTKIGQRVCIALFCGLLGIPLVAQLCALVLGREPFLPDERQLSPVPSIEESGITPQFFREVDDWYRDHFGLRGRMIQANSLLSLKALRSSPIARVIPGRGDWLFITDILPTALAARELSDVRLAQITHLFTLQQDMAKSVGAQFAVTVVPVKSTVYPDQLPTRLAGALKDGPGRQILSSLQQAGIQTVDLLPVLQEARGTSPEPIYHLTDTHWTASGARAAAAELSAIFGLPAPDYPESGTIEWPGDIAKMMLLDGVLPDEEIVYDLPEFQTEDDWRDELSLVTTQGAADGPRMTMIRDSFAIALIPFLSPVTSQANYHWGETAEYTAIADEAPDILLAEYAEHFAPIRMIRTPDAPAFPLESAPDGEEASGTFDLFSRWRDGALVVTGTALPEGTFDFLGAEPLCTLTDEEGTQTHWSAWPVYVDQVADEETAVERDVETPGGLKLILPGFPEGAYQLRIGWRAADGRVLWLSEPQPVEMG